MGKEGEGRKKHAKNNPCANSTSSEAGGTKQQHDYATRSGGTTVTDEPKRPSAMSVPPVTSPQLGDPGQQSIMNDVKLILSRMDSIDGKIKSIDDQLKGMATKFAEDDQRYADQLVRTTYVERKLNQVCNTNRMLRNRLDVIENREKINNIILYGKTEEEGEDITSYVGLVG